MRGEWSRREFLGAGAGVLAGSLVPWPGQEGAFQPAAPKSRVVQVGCPDWLKEEAEGKPEVQGKAVAASLQKALMRLTGKSQADAAMKVFVSAKETVAIKFNRLSHNYTAANQAFLSALTELLQAAGVDKKRILVVEGLGCDPAGYGTPDTTPHAAYQVPNTQRDGKKTRTETRLTRLVELQADCIINVVDLKNHGIAGITGSLKNLALAGGSFMTDPGAFHGGMCDPSVAEINNLKPLREKARLQVVNGLKGVFEGGPIPRQPSYQWRQDAILAATDRVAIDRVCWELINQARQKHGRPPVPRVPSIASAAALGLGTDDLARIEWLKEAAGRV